ncbi:MAG: hypothetical protein KDD56_07215 [Bdellovibrionales bacterium]|nr:hypothetical protein [Bdellovibrionales bacterium]
MKLSRLMAIDPSLTCSGWALFCIDSKKLLGVGRVKSIKSSNPFNIRVADLQKKIIEILKSIDFNSNDVLISEAPTSIKDPDAAIKVEQVRSIFETVARTFNANVPGRINPRSVQTEVIGLSGKQVVREEVKSHAVGTARFIYSKELIKIGFSDLDNLAAYQDIVDALLIGHLALSKIEAAKSAGVLLEEFLEPERRKNSSRRRLRAI